MQPELEPGCAFQRDCVLFITPDYPSHFNPLVPVARAAVAAGHRVVFAAGPALKPRVIELGFAYVELLVGEESNTGLIRPERARLIRASFSATSRGWIPALIEQANGRIGAFLWHAEEVAARTMRIIETLQPSYVIVVQLCYAAVAALTAGAIPFATFVTGHPTQLPMTHEVYGFPICRPSALCASDGEVATLHSICIDVQRRFTEEFNSVLRGLNPGATPLLNALAAASDRLVLYNYPGQLMTARSPLLPTRSLFLGACIRTQAVDAGLAHWLESRRPNVPTIYVAFGTYFSVRSDVLRRVARALQRIDAQVVFATGLAHESLLGRLPEHWYVQPFVPQVAVLPHCDLAISHGGNNTVTEALWSGVPLAVAPFASDQFQGAASIEEHGLGAAFDPNNASIEEIAVCILGAMETRPRAQTLGLELRAKDGPRLAIRACMETFGPPSAVV